MSRITGLSSSQIAALEREARNLVASYDRDRDGAIDRDERERFSGADSYTFSQRDYWNDDLVKLTTVYQNHYKGVRMDALQTADTNQDGRLIAGEMVEAYLADRDTNHDGNLSAWERFKMSFQSLTGQFERSWSVETHRSTRVIYDPLPYYEPPSDPYRPAPPRVDPRPPRDPYRPTPPAVDPRPPKIDPRRPAPPPVDPRSPYEDPYRTAPSGSRKRPPKVNADRPAPPAVDPDYR